VYDNLPSLKRHIRFYIHVNTFSNYYNSLCLDHACSYLFEKFNSFRGSKVHVLICHKKFKDEV